MKKILLFSILLLTFSSIMAQSNYKIGHINTQLLLELMPESTEAKSKVESFIKEIQQYQELMQKEYNSKLKEYTDKKNTWSQTIREIKEMELRDINNRIMDFQTSAEENIERQKLIIYKPVLDKAKNAISDVSKEKQLTYVFDLTEGTVIYHDENSLDILPLVKQKLNIK